MSRSFFRSSLAVASAAATALVLVACSEPTEGGSDTDADSTAASGDEQVTITVYTSEPEEKVDEINAAFMEAHPDINVEVYRAGTGDLNPRIASEKQSGDIEADVLWAADSPTFEGYAADGDLAELQNVDTEGSWKKSSMKKASTLALALSQPSSRTTLMWSAKTRHHSPGRI